ncbi:hypothetical protein BCY91_16600 [Pelobium manganitolerans]|uniref:Uncharacterized protein n=1 Tax=Pelobium manganitolerans TaxID=1842495 RepID=A0A419S897_9SPHI|nr:hypothetical protein BCY91_16600 [Pelobium manganitolerans]
MLPHDFLFKNRYAFLFHFKSKGISVFLTQKQGRAFLVCKKNLHPFGSYFFDKTLFLLNTNLFMLVKRNKAYSGSLDE